ncbi:uncharacterized protein LOC129762647 isoform X2 [Toxorhynchites rutilus septentrionalis]|uniref:uncharacterized protein LOC129762647 isoform X2 n=1 Tax=Toxorhynchites rutilus septentrionalis TaxID=329112 RepID=UPI0024791BCA|nr:uncharacterized protein LOC129762647 isoform X2 [Toxorhynchites rutilus septentrionalis]
MKRKYWGSFEDSSDKKKEVSSNEIILPMTKMEKFQQIKLPYTITRRKRIPLKNPLVTQTVEVMNQTEMIQTLIDTYSTKSGHSYILNPCQLMPNIDFPPANTADLSNYEKITRPFWFVNPHESKFTRGEPQNYPKLSRPVLLQALRKVICGLLRVIGFSEINESALIMMIDGVDQFMSLLCESMRDVLVSESRETESVLDILTLEKGFYSVTKKSITSLHNYYKEIDNKNKNEIREFKDIFQEYDKLLQENHLSAAQSLQQTGAKMGEIKEEEYISFLDVGQHSQQSTGPSAISSVTNTMDGTSTINIISFLNGDGTGTSLKDILEGNLLETNRDSSSDHTGQQQPQESYHSET